MRVGEEATGSIMDLKIKISIQQWRWSPVKKKKAKKAQHPVMNLCFIPAPLLQLESRSSDFGVLICVMPECGSNTDAKKYAL